MPFAVYLVTNVRCLGLNNAMLRTGSSRLADKGNELLLYLLHCVQVVHKKHMSVAGLTGDIHQFSIVGIRKANSEDDIAWEFN